VLLAFLGNLRAGLIVASTIPLSMLVAFTGMAQTRISANLMSLGAIDFGLIVDGAVVLVENVVRRLGEPEGQGKTARQLTGEAAHEVLRPIAFGIGIIIIVYLPILDPGRRRREDVQADGLGGGLRPGRLAPAEPDPDPCPGLALPRQVARGA
jgi:Cu/Ag efflux pump CusA